VTGVFVAAGSNVEPVANLCRALDGLRRHYPRLRCSPAYRNRAAGFAGDDFVNLVIAFDTDERLGEVIGRLQDVEADCGRARDAPRWAPRSMDLDILLFGDLVHEEAGLVLPRPDLLRRAYMLGPMADLAPELVHPVLGRTMRELWAAFDRAAHELHPVDLGWRGGGAG
jgi:2-amino-4-hydroxy-6-hydroxymethyldihydropteridine diphosphokinase